MQVSKQSRNGIQNNLSQNNINDKSQVYINNSKKSQIIS
jgi:hypothetical protein